MVVQERDAMALIKIKSLDRGKPNGIKVCIRDKKNRNVYIFYMGVGCGSFPGKCLKWWQIQQYG